MRQATQVVSCWKCLWLDHKVRRESRRERSALWVWSMPTRGGPRRRKSSTYPPTTALASVVMTCFMKVDTLCHPLTLPAAPKGQQQCWARRGRPWKRKKTTQNFRCSTLIGSRRKALEMYYFHVGKTILDDKHRLMMLTNKSRLSFCNVWKNGMGELTGDSVR